MTRIKLIALILLLSSGVANALQQPAGMSVDGLRFSWNPVAGASLYRVAVWQDKKTLIAAVWVKTANWTYGDLNRVVPRAGNLPSTAMPILNSGSGYRLWVSAANEKGSGKSGWATIDFIAPAFSQTVTATPTQVLEEIPVTEFREKPQEKR